MSRTKSYEKADLARRAMHRFWSHGYYATSIQDLVKVTGVNRHGLYAEYGDKLGVFVAALEQYFENFVGKAFGPVETPGAGLKEIRGYFSGLIDRADAAGLPGPGCFAANTMVECAPQEQAICLLIKQHLSRLTSGFAQALTNAKAAGQLRSAAKPDDLALYLTISAQGLWSFSRTTGDAALLRRYVDQLLAPLETGATP